MKKAKNLRNKKVPGTRREIGVGGSGIHRPVRTDLPATRKDRRSSLSGRKKRRKTKKEKKKKE